MSAVPALLRAQMAVVPATLPEGAARADLARGQRAYGRAPTAAEENGARAAVLLPRYGFARFALPMDVLFLASASDSEEDGPETPVAEGRAAYAQAAQRGRIDIPSGDLLDLKV